jgi:hypothetical protein
VPAPDVPAVLVPAVLVAPAAAVLALEPIVAFVRIHSFAPARAVLAVAPAVPLVPVAPAAPCSPCCRQPVTVIVLLLELPGVWLVCEVELFCAPSVAAQVSAIANVAPVHTRFIVLPP